MKKIVSIIVLSLFSLFIVWYVFFSNTKTVFYTKFLDFCIKETVISNKWKKNVLLNDKIKRVDKGFCEKTVYGFNEKDFYYLESYLKEVFEKEIK